MKTYHNCKLTKDAIDLILKEMASIFTNLGSDSTLEEIQQAYALENALIDKIKEIDPEKAKSIRPYVD